MDIKKQILLNDEQETIVALCTPRGSGAIGVIRLSGKDSIKIASSLAQLSSKKELLDQSSHTIHHGFVVNKHVNHHEIIDEVLFSLMREPRTFTGQDTVEISCHNNSFIINNIIRCALQYGAREAKPGEFTKRAYLNGKIDLLQAEAIHDIILAQSEASLKASLAQVQGSLSHHIKNLEQAILMLLSLTEASFEFLEEEQQDIALQQMVKENMNAVIKTVRTLKAQYDQQHVIRDGIRIAIIGNVNAGKSTLFNALADKNRAIVSEIAGTTRDSIEYNIIQDGIFWQLIDTAGLRSTNDTIEQQGIERAFDEAKTADIMLLVCDGSKPLSEQELSYYQELYKTHDKKIIFVINKSDLPENNNILKVGNPENDMSSKIIKVSAKNNVNIDTLKKIIKEKINQLFTTHTSPYLLNQRHALLLTEIEDMLNFIANSYLESLEYELVAYQLRNLLERVAEITGKNTSEEILATVFSTFCIGK